MRRVAVKYLRYLPDAGLCQMRLKAGKYLRNARFRFLAGTVHFSVSIDERADQPRPDRALVIGRIALANGEPM